MRSRRFPALGAGERTTRDRLNSPPRDAHRWQTRRTLRGACQNDNPLLPNEAFVCLYLYGGLEEVFESSVPHFAELVNAAVHQNLVSVANDHSRFECNANLYRLDVISCSSLQNLW